MLLIGNERHAVRRVECLLFRVPPFASTSFVGTPRAGGDLPDSRRAFTASVGLIVGIPSTGNARLTSCISKEN